MSILKKYGGFIIFWNVLWSLLVKKLKEFLNSLQPFFSARYHLSQDNQITP